MGRGVNFSPVRRGMGFLGGRARKCFFCKRVPFLQYKGRQVPKIPLHLIKRARIQKIFSRATIVGGNFYLTSRKKQNFPEAWRGSLGGLKIFYARVSL